MFTFTGIPKFRRFLRQYRMVSKPAAAIRLFKKASSNFKRMIPVSRSDVDFYGEQDDAQLMDEVLFEELKDGFDEYVTHAIAFQKPNVIFTDLDGTEWPKKTETAVGRHWVVTVEYHD
jgi:hypothetical protein